jgi:fatty-acyl-CoA synthase
LESAAIGIPDEKWGERPLVIVVLKPEFKNKLSGEDLRRFMLNFAQEGKLSKYGVPDKYEFVEEIPKTSVGKIDKKVLRKSYLNLV